MDKNKWTQTYFSKCVISSKAKWSKFKISKSNLANGVLRRESILKEVSLIQSPCRCWALRGYLSMMMTSDIMDLKLNEFEIHCIFLFRAGQSKMYIHLQMIIWRDWPPAMPAMIVRRIQPHANNNLEDPHSCKWSSGRFGHLQMIIQKIRPLANDQLEDLATCKWSSGGSGHLQMIIWRDRPLANDHPEDPASCKWSSGGSGLLQMIICHPRHPNHLSQDPDSILRTFLEKLVLVLFQYFPYDRAFTNFISFIYDSKVVKMDLGKNASVSSFPYLHREKSQSCANIDMRMFWIWNADLEIFIQYFTLQLSSYSHYIE